MDYYIGLFILQLFIFAVAAAFGGVCYLAVAAATRKVSSGRRFALWTALLFPLVAILYLETGFLIQDVIRYSRGSDSLLDGLYHYPLVDGYQLVIFNEDPSSGHIDGPGGFNETADAVQVAGNFIFIDQGEPPSAHRPLPSGGYIYEGTNSSPTVELGHETKDLSDKLKRELAENPPKEYLVVDIKSSKRTRLNLEELNKTAEREGVALSLIPAQKAMSIAASAALPGSVFWGLLIAPVLVAIVWLLQKLRQLVRSV